MHFLCVVPKSKHDNMKCIAIGIVWMHFMRTQNAIRKSDQTKIHLILTPHLLCESIMFGYHCAMCSNREKSLVINSGSISIIILVERGKTRRSNVLRVYCQRADFHIAYCIYVSFFCFVIILFPFFAVFFYLRNKHQITVLLCSS